MSGPAAYRNHSLLHLALGHSFYRSGWSRISATDHLECTHYSAWYRKHQNAVTAGGEAFAAGEGHASQESARG